MIWLKRVNLALPLIALSLTGCVGSHGTGSGSGTKLAVSPSSITVDAGSTTTFMGVFTPVAPTGGSLTWSVTPVNGGTITGAGVFTASSTAGPYTVLATWTPSNSTMPAILTGSAAVKVLAVPQADSAINPEQVQAAGANQSAGAIQNGAIVGQGIPAVFSVDSGGNIQVRSSFGMPAPCPGSQIACQ